jgi:ribosome-associated protein
MEKIIIRDEYITLGQLLKLSGTAQTGGQAKFMIADGRVRVNGHIVLQRGKKVFPGDVVGIDGQDIYEVILKE